MESESLCSKVGVGDESRLLESLLDRLVLGLSLEGDLSLGGESGGIDRA